MNLLRICLLLLIPIGCLAQHRIQKRWETAKLAHPECVLNDGGILYASLVDGKPLVVDGKGGIAKLDTTGKILDGSWVTGLNAPKGMGLWNGKLYVTDITKVIVIDTRTGRIESSILVPGSAGLNDIAIDDKGVLFVSDPELNKVYRITNGSPVTYLSNLKAANGLKVVGDDLYILVDNALLKVTPGGKIVSLVNIETGGDGVQPIGNGDFLLSRYSGVLYYFDARKGSLQTLLDTRAQRKSAADFDYDPIQHMIYVPTLTNDSVVAYRLY